jgi:polyisoprenoid-binding protein YceI
LSTNIATQPFTGTYEADTAHSSFGFAIRHGGISTFRGTLNAVAATVTADDGEVSLVGSAKAESISVQEPAQFRAHLLSAEFFDAETYPDVTFRSTSVTLDEDGTATVEGDLTIKDVTRPVTATGTYAAPRTGPGDRTIAAFELETTFDRRDFGLNWQMDLPNGDLAIEWDVTLEVHLEVFRPGDEA